MPQVEIVFMAMYVESACPVCGEMIGAKGDLTHIPRDAQVGDVERSLLPYLEEHMIAHIAGHSN